MLFNLITKNKYIKFRVVNINLYVFYGGKMSVKIFTKISRCKYSSKPTNYPRPTFKFVCHLSKPNRNNRSIQTSGCLSKKLQGSILLIGYGFVYFWVLGLITRKYKFPENKLTTKKGPSMGWESEFLSSLSLSIVMVIANCSHLVNL